MQSDMLAHDNASFYLGGRHFSCAVGVAVVAHLCAFLAWSITPKDMIMDVPVRVLNIKLGGGEDNSSAGADTKKTRMTINNATAEKHQEHLVRNPPQARKIPATSPPKERPAQEVTQSTATPLNSLEQSARQFVRARSLSAENAAALSPASGDGSVFGTNSASNADMLKRYEQMISFWIQRYKVYPQEARRQNMHGRGVIRIRINRQGTIVYRIIEQRTGYDMLDKAMLEMVQRANPVPPVPANYPRSGELLEFLVPVSYTAQ